MAKRSRAKQDLEQPGGREASLEEQPKGGPSPLLFPVIGLGGSAGALAALQVFFEAMPAGCGMAFVVVLHLSPEHESQLAGLLQGRTPMPMMQVTGRVTMALNCVYVIPPGKNLSMEDGDLVLTDFEQPRGHRSPIDHFFRTHASEHPDGVAVVLSGGGADGTLGIKAVKEAGGLVMAQDPDEAEHPSMPRNAISTGVVDVVAPAASLARRLVAYRDRLGALCLPAEPDALPADDEVTLRKILARLQNRTGHDFTSYKRSTVLRRLGRRMHVHGLDTLGAYLGYLLGNQEEAEALFKDLLISVTQFFRDPEAFDALAVHVLPALVAALPKGEPVRVWAPGCATGEEAYSLAIVLLEYLAPLNQRLDLQIFATDIDENALETAREGHYPQAIEADVSEVRLKRFFTWEGERYYIRPHIFAPRCASASFLRRTTSSEIRPSPRLTSFPVATCSSICSATCRRRSSISSTTPSATGAS